MLRADGQCDSLMRLQPKNLVYGRGKGGRTAATSSWTLRTYLPTFGEQLQQYRPIAGPCGDNRRGRLKTEKWRAAVARNGNISIPLCIEEGRRLGVKAAVKLVHMVARGESRPTARKESSRPLRIIGLQGSALRVSKVPLPSLRLEGCQRPARRPAQHQLAVRQGFLRAAEFLRGGEAEGHPPGLVRCSLLAVLAQPALRPPPGPPPPPSLLLLPVPLLSHLSPMILAPPRSFPR